MLLRLAIKCPLILSGLRNTNKEHVPTGTQTSTPAPGCRGGHMDVTASQPQALQPMWKEAILICKVAVDLCLLPRPPFCSGRTAHAQESFPAETVATAGTETLDLRDGGVQQGHASNTTPRPIFNQCFWVVPHKKLGRQCKVVITWQALSLPDLINQSGSERGSNFHGMLPNSFLCSASDPEVLYIPQHLCLDQQAYHLPLALHSPTPVNPVFHIPHTQT